MLGSSWVAAQLEATQGLVKSMEVDSDLHSDSNQILTIAVMWWMDIHARPYVCGVFCFSCLS
jgi:hypothetical protein